jgi:hypothetical protein
VLRVMNCAAVNIARCSSIGAAQAVRAGARAIIVSSPSTIATYANGGPLKVARGYPGLERRPSPDHRSQRRRSQAVQRAGSPRRAGRAA